MELFKGSVRSFGQYNPKKDIDPHYTVKKAPTVEDFEKHLKGETGIGIVPIFQDRYCSWGAIDIDEDNIDHVALESAVRAEDLPLVVCRSKSGGAHLYLFLREPVLAPAVRSALTAYAKKLGYGGVEIFPKQNETSDGILGNWINLPYFGGDETTRNAFEGGKAISLSHFLENARNKAVSRNKLFNPDKEHVDAPPCVQSMIHNGLGSGMRNEGSYTIAIYLKRAFPETWKDMMMDVNASFTEPLPAKEVRTIISSIARKDYLYKCKTEPCKSLCDSNTCITRKFGITPTEQKTIVNVEVPVFAKLKKYTTEPVYWELEVNGSLVRVSTEDLADYKRLQLRVMDWQTRLIPGMKTQDWHVILDGLMSEATIEEAPDEASAPGQVRARLVEFLTKAQQLDNAADRENLLRGMPCVEYVEGKTIALFTGPSFQKYLKDNRTEEVRGAQLWMALRKMMVYHRRIKVQGEVVPVWYCELKDGKPKLAVDLSLPDFDTEF